MIPGRVIVTYGRSLMSLVIAQSLSRRGVEVIGCDDVDLTVLSFSDYVDETFVHESPDDGEDQYIESLLRGVRKYKPEDDRPYILMPVFRNTRLIARHRERFEPHITVAAPDWSSISKVFPKENLARTAHASGANAPESIYAETQDELREKLESLKPPFLLKPVAGVGGRGIERFDDAKSAIDAYGSYLKNNREAPLIQECVDGEDYCFTGLFKDGDLLAHMAYRNLRNFPVENGAGAIRETVDDQIFLEPVQKLMKNTGWTGVAEIDFMWTGKPDAEPYLIEVNPRFWAGLFHSVKSGVDFPWLLYQLFAKGDVHHIPEANIGETTKTPGLWLASAVQEIAQSDIKFDRLNEIWSENRDQNLFEKVRQSGTALKDAVSFDDACFRIMDTFDLAKNSSDELSERQDPLAGLGILFILSSLARHGRLPEEVKF